MELKRTYDGYIDTDIPAFNQTRMELKLSMF